MKSPDQNFLLICLILLLTFPVSYAQITLPAASPRAKLTQLVGLTEVTVDYSRPNVVLNGKDRSGEIWGQLVPWEMTPNQMTGRSYPWRAGADENTVISFSNPVSIEGRPLPAGSYSFHMIPHENGEATLIFNKNDHQWGSFMYDDQEDALRVKVKSQEGPQHNLLTYSFPEVSQNSAVCELAWEQKRFSFAIEVNTPGLTVEHIKKEIGQSKGFVWQAYNAAAKYCLDHEVQLEQGMKWVDQGILNFGGNYALYDTKAGLLEKQGKSAEAETYREKALAVGSVRDLHGYGYALVTAGKTDEGFEVLKKNYDRYYALNYGDAVDECIVNLGLAMGFAAKKDMEMSRKYGKVAVEKAPPALKSVAEGFVARVQKVGN